VFVSIAASRRPYTPSAVPLTISLVVGGGLFGYLYWLWYGVAVGVVTGLLLGPFAAAASRPATPDQMRWLDRRRKWIGLDQSLSEDQLARLESAAQDWERIDNAMESEAWRSQPRLAARTARGAEDLMSRLIERALAGQGSDEAGMLRELAGRVDAVTGSMGAYGRPMFDSSGVVVGTGLPAVSELELMLSAIGSGVIISDHRSEAL
jgi:hypothetical protein